VDGDLIFAIVVGIGTVLAVGVVIWLLEKS
jgi:hypothetical protein